MWANRLAVVAGLWGVLSTAELADAQKFDSAPDRDFRLEAEIERMNGSWIAMCGYLYNNRHLAARNLRIQVTGFDASRAVLSTHDLYLVGGIPASGRAYFCVPVVPAATAYGFAVLTADWGFSDGT